MAQQMDYVSQVRYMWCGRRMVRTIQSNSWTMQLGHMVLREWLRLLLRSGCKRGHRLLSVPSGT